MFLLFLVQFRLRNAPLSLSRTEINETINKSPDVLSVRAISLHLYLCIAIKRAKCQDIFSQRGNTADRQIFITFPRWKSPE